MNALHTATTLLVTSLMTQAHAAEDDRHSPLGAHQHSVAELNVAIDGEQLMLELVSPAYSLLGFEHQPRTEAQRAAVTRLQRYFTDDKAFRFDTTAQCQLAEFTIETELLAENHHREEGHGDEGHSEFHLTYQYRCQQPQKLSRIELPLWQQFEQLRALQGQITGPQGQQRLSLNRGGHLQL